jgi:hypothetical protein
MNEITVLLQLRCEYTVGVDLLGANVFRLLGFDVPLKSTISWIVVV